MEQKDINLSIVVSAMGGKPKVTDILLKAVKEAASRKDFCVLLQQVEEKHIQCIQELKLNNTQNLIQTIREDLEEIKDILKTVSILKWEAKRISELVAGYGEIWSTQIFCALLNQRTRSELFGFVNARRFICIDESAISALTVCWDMCQENLNKIYKDFPPKVHLVITGYVASNTEGVATTLHISNSMPKHASELNVLLENIKKCNTAGTESKPPIKCCKPTNITSGQNVKQRFEYSSFDCIPNISCSFNLSGRLYSRSTAARILDFIGPFDIYTKK